MLSFAVPWIMWLAGVGVVVVGALHLLSVRQPPELLLPTARFVPDGASRAVARRPRPNDLLLLLLRVVALLTAAAAVAGARCTRSHGRTLQLVAFDDAPRGSDVGGWRKAVAGALSAGATVEWLPVARIAEDPGVVLVRALQQAEMWVRRDAGIDSIALTVVLPARVSSRRAWDAWRSQWPGRVQLLAADSLAQGREASEELLPLRPMERLPDDGVTAALRWNDSMPGGPQSTREVRLFRRMRPTPSQMLPTLTPAQNVVLLDWPIDGRPEGWVPRTSIDTVGAVVARGQAIIGPWERVAGPDTGLLRDSAVTPIAWWGDGEVAAVERQLVSAPGVSRACVRRVAMRVPEGTDLLLGTAADGLRRALRAPCGSAEVPLHALVASERAAGARRPLVPAATLRATARGVVHASPAWLTPLLAALACCALLAEWWWRRQEDAR